MPAIDRDSLRQVAFPFDDGMARASESFEVYPLDILVLARMLKMQPSVLMAERAADDCAHLELPCP